MHLHLSPHPLTRVSIQAIDHSRRACPVCKADCSVLTVVPIYVREENSNANNAASDEVDDMDSMVCGEDIGEGEDQNEDEDDFFMEDNGDGEQQNHQNDFLDDNENVIGEGSDTQSTLHSTGLRRRRIKPENLRTNNASIPSRGETNSTILDITSTSLDNASTNPEPFPSRPQPPPAPPSTILPDSIRQNHNNRHSNNRTTQAFFDVVMGLQARHAAASTSAIIDPHSNVEENANSSRHQTRQIPSLHDIRQNQNVEGGGGGDARVHGNIGPIEEATVSELLSRILLTLGSLVILCLLVF